MTERIFEFERAHGHNLEELAKFDGTYPEWDEYDPDFLMQKDEQEAERAWLRHAEDNPRYRDEVDEDLRRNGEPGL